MCEQRVPLFVFNIKWVLFAYTPCTYRWSFVSMCVQSLISVLCFLFNFFIKTVGENYFYGVIIFLLVFWMFLCCSFVVYRLRSQHTSFFFDSKRLIYYFWRKKLQKNCLAWQITGTAAHLLHTCIVIAIILLVAT